VDRATVRITGTDPDRQPADVLLGAGDPAERVRGHFIAWTDTRTPEGRDAASRWPAWGVSRPRRAQWVCGGADAAGGPST